MAKSDHNQPQKGFNHIVKNSSATILKFPVEENVTMSEVYTCQKWTARTSHIISKNIRMNMKSINRSIVKLKQDKNLKNGQTFGQINISNRVSVIYV